MTPRLASALVVVAVLAAVPVAVPGGAQTTLVTVDDFVALSAPDMAGEGDEVTVTATFTGPGAAPQALFVWGDGSQDTVVASGGVAEASHTFADDFGGGLNVIRVNFDSSDGNRYRGTHEILVTNAPPSVDPIADAVAPLDDLFALQVAFDDPGAADTHGVAVDWGDGTVTTLDARTRATVELSHTYDAVATHTATVTVTDDEGATDAASFEVEVALSCLGFVVTIDLNAPGPHVTNGVEGDVILGTPGDDIIRSGRGDDVVCGGGGDDTLILGPGNDLGDGGDGDDTVLGRDGTDTLFGGRGDDIIRGSRGPDQADGGTGKDVVVGGAGDDELDGGPQDDRIRGGGGSDTLLGGRGRDVVVGNKGGDAVSGGIGDDVVKGGAHDDVLWGGDGADVVRGQSGTDLLFRSESPNRDRFHGGPGEDVISVGKRGSSTNIRNHLTEEEALAFKGFHQLSGFTTYHACCANRVVNIQTMADTVHGHVVMPGETWGVNHAVGRRTTAKGYLSAGAIIGGWVQCCDHPANIGGGTSQFGTTIYNAVFFSGATDIEHQPHSLDFARYPDGREATMGYPHPDVVFANPFDHPILITTHHGGYTGTSITVRFWGDNGGIEVEARDSGRYNVFGTSKVVYEPDSSLPPDQEIIDTRSSNGYSIDVYRDITWPGGTTTTESWTWTYSAGPEVRRVHPCRIPAGDPEYTGEPCPYDGGGEPPGVEPV